MKKSIVIIPTYNEKETLPLIIDSVLKHGCFDVLVVDDNSPDETAGVVQKIMASEERVFLIKRDGKLGLGTAYIEGFKWALDRGYHYLIEMDADRSHDPDALPAFIGEMEKGLDMVIGSRYLDGRINVVGWDFRRLLLSKFGNLYASVLLGLKLTDLTSGFRCYSKIALESINLNKIWSNGYAFQIEMAYRVSIAGLSMGEIPIIFHERTAGTSKMSKRIVLEAMLFPWRARFLQILNGLRRTTTGGFRKHG
jgi:dolichol-phosphate mannosyltransferase